MFLLLPFLAASAAAPAPAPVAGHEFEPPAIESSRGPAHQTVEEDGFHPEFVPADASFLLFLDVARLRGSALGLIWGSPAMAEQRDKILGEIGFDPIQECSSITIFSSGDDSDEGAGVALMSDAVDGFIGGLMEEEGFESFQREGVELLHFEDTYAHIETRGDQRLIVFSDDPGRVVGGTMVLRGEAKSLAAGGGEAAEFRPAPDSFLFACVRELPPALQAFRPTSRVMKLAQSLRFDLGQRDEFLVSRLEVKTESRESARNTADVIRGTVALARLAGGSDIPEALYGLLNGLHIGVDESSVTLDLSYPIEAVMGLLSSMVEED